MKMSRLILLIGAFSSAIPVAHVMIGKKQNAPDNSTHAKQAMANIPNFNGQFK